METTTQIRSRISFTADGAHLVVLPSRPGRKGVMHFVRQENGRYRRMALFAREYQVQHVVLSYLGREEPYALTREVGTHGKVRLYKYHPGQPRGKWEMVQDVSLDLEISRNYWIGMHPEIRWAGVTTPDFRLMEPQSSAPLKLGWIPPPDGLATGRDMTFDLISEFHSELDPYNLLSVHLGRDGEKWGPYFRLSDGATSFRYPNSGIHLVIWDNYRNSALVAPVWEPEGRGFLMAMKSGGMLFVTTQGFLNPERNSHPVAISIYAEDRFARDSHYVSIACCNSKRKVLTVAGVTQNHEVEIWEKRDRKWYNISGY